MGTWSKIRKAGRWRKGQTNRNPLRKIIRIEQVSLGITDTGIDVLVNRERLECGHLVRPRTDITGGETNAMSRRCAECGKEDK